uniref:Melanoma cell adhesion molecule n=1 Tax=Taeniopygia guttata TaxID=59729 RepID=H0YQ36_TAEGU
MLTQLLPPSLCPQLPYLGWLCCLGTGCCPLCRRLCLLGWAGRKEKATPMGWQGWVGMGCQAAPQSSCPGVPPSCAAGLPSPAWPLALQVDRSNKQVRLFHVTASGVMEDDTDYKQRLSLGEDKALSLSAVTLQDARTFMCQVGAGSYGVGESSTELSVYKVPTTPEIEPVSGGISIAKCVSKNSFPAPNITWHRNGEQLHNQENDVAILSTVTRESSGLYTVSSTLYAPVTREDRHSRYHCTVHYWLQGHRRALDSQRVKINVFYPAEHLTLQVVPSSTLVKEGDNVTLVCEADGTHRPFSASLRKRELDDWQDVTPLADPDNGVLKLHDVNKTSSGTYRCQTLDLDDLSQIEEEVDLVVNYIEGVHVKMEPSSTLREGDSVMLSCDANSPVGLKYQWRDEKGKKLVEGNQLFLKNLTFETSSNFSCRVMAPSVPGLEQSKKVSVAVEGKPRIVAISSPLYVRQDEVINLTCKAIAFPPPTVQWSINGTAHEFVDKQHIASNLTVRVSHELLQAGAMCRVSNKLGVSEKHIQLLVGECQALLAVPGKGKIPCGQPSGQQELKWKDVWPQVRSREQEWLL